MRRKKFLAAILLVMSFCFVSGVGYGEIAEWTLERTVLRLDYSLGWAMLFYVWDHKTDFLVVIFSYDSYVGEVKFSSKPDVSTGGKILIEITDSRGIFSNKSGIALLNLFRKTLKDIYSYIEDYATDMDADVVAILMAFPGGNELAYFYQGEYHLWED